MKPFLDARTSVTAGSPIVIESDSIPVRYGAVFEDDGDTGYFYARDYSQDSLFVDALHIYTVKTVPEADASREIRIIWSPDWQKTALLLNDIPQAMFDFAAKRGYSRDAFPDPDPKTGWTHGAWEKEVRMFFYSDDVK